MAVRHSNPWDTRTVKIFYRAGVFVEKEEDLPEPSHTAQAQSSPDEAWDLSGGPAPSPWTPTGADGRFTVHFP